MAKACCAWPSKQLERPYSWNHRRQSSKKWSLRLEQLKWRNGWADAVDDSEVISAGDMKRDAIVELSQEMFEEEVLKFFFFVVFFKSKIPC